MAIQRLEEIPAICMNQECDNYKAFELVDVDGVSEETDGTGFIHCHSCNKKIIIK